MPPRPQPVPARIYHEGGQIMAGERFPKCAVVSTDLWRENCINMGLSGSDKEEARRKAFRRAMDDLTQRGLVLTWSNYVWTKFDADMMG